MLPLQLKDLAPRGSTFRLKAMDKDFRLRPVNLEDEIWLKETFGASAGEIFQKQLWPQIFQIVFHQLELEDKREFVKREIEIIDGDGVAHKKTMGGYRLLYGLVSGHDEKLRVMEALLETIGISRDIQKVLTEEETKKAEARLKAEEERLAALTPEQREEEEKKSHLIGQESSIDSQQPTDGPPSTSSPEP